MRGLLLLFALSACATSHETSRNLPLADRFEIVAFEPNDRSYYDDRLWRWGWPIRVEIIGSRAYRDLVAAQVTQLGEITGLPVEMDSGRATMLIEFSRRDQRSYCNFRLLGSPGAYVAEIYIATDQPERHIRRCITQELSQAMGLLADTDGRRDTAFSSGIGTEYLTEADLALFAILYDRRLRAGMSREEAMPIVRRIVAELEAMEEIPRR